MSTFLHPASSRGSADYGWLKTNYSFSFADYYNPARMGFGALLVINDDEVGAGKGFGMHPHDNMEIITIPLVGTLAHRDSMGFATEIKAGEVQMMSAGTGIRHSEINPSLTEPCKLFQIWIVPNERNIVPRYQQKEMKPIAGATVLVASPDGAENSLKIQQKAWIHWAAPRAGQCYTYSLKNEKNGLYVLVVSGALNFSDKNLGERDALGIVSEGEELKFETKADTSVLFFEVPMHV